MTALSRVIIYNFKRLNCTHARTCTNTYRKAKSRPGRLDARLSQDRWMDRSSTRETIVFFVGIFFKNEGKKMKEPF